MFFCNPMSILKIVNNKTSFPIIYLLILNFCRFSNMNFHRSSSVLQQEKIKLDSFEF